MWLLDPCYGQGKFFNATFCCDTPPSVYSSDASIGTISILVGSSGSSVSSGDGGLAANAALESPGAISIDNRNYLFIAEGGGTRLRQVSPGDLKGQRYITSVAGFTGGQVSSSDGPSQMVPLTKASFQSISSISFRPRTNAMLLADKDRVRRIDSPRPDNVEWHGMDNGLTSNVSTTAGPSTLLGPPSSPTLISVSSIVESKGSLFIADQGAGVIYKLPLPTDNSTLLTAATGSFEVVVAGVVASGLAVDPLTGDLFYSDVAEKAVKKINVTGATTIIAGTSLPFNVTLESLCGPQGLAFTRTEEDGPALFMADSCSGRVLKVDLKSGRVITILRPLADLPLSGLSSLNPTSLAFDADGNLYVSESNNNQVWMISRLCVFSGRCQVNVDSSNLSSSKVVTMMNSNYIGCFSDDNDRKLPWILSNASDIWKMTVELCNSRAVAAGLPFFGVQYA